MLVTILVDGLVFSSYLFLVSVGLSITFGVMKILNFAHGAFFAWGAYVTAYFINRIPLAGTSLSVALAIIFVSAVAVGLIFSLVLERGLLRTLYGRPEVIILLVTYGVFLVLENMIIIVFGVEPYFASQPMDLMGSTVIGSIARDNYSLSLIALAGVVAIGCWLLLARTKWGKLTRTVMFDPEMSVALGINVLRVYIATFALGAVLGALGGACVTPLISVAPGLGVDIVVLSFAVVVIGGMGSIPGALIGALVIGISRAVAVHYAQQFELFIVYAIMAAVLMVRPEGLFSQPRARRI